VANKISIIGCGWLGLPLAKHLIACGHTVKGSTTSIDKLNKLSSHGIEPYFIDVGEQQIRGDIEKFLRDTDVLVINIPPGLRRNPGSDYPARIKRFMRHVVEAQLSELIYISSTSVFADQRDMPIYTEEDLPNPSTEKDKKLFQAELMIREHFHTATIIRPGGLIGEDRHPVKYLAGKKGLSNPDAPINLTSRDYLMDLILKVIEKDIQVPVLHAISEPHLSRKQYYSSAAEERGLELPEFNDDKSVGKKIVSVVI
jgi:nucleoside-diphosphate-sugar epimerase